MPSNPPNDENGENPKDPFQEMFERLLGSGAMKPGDMPAGMPVEPQTMSMMFQPVSYTHLDVYQRQRMVSVTSPPRGR